MLRRPEATGADCVVADRRRSGGCPGSVVVVRACL